MKQILFATTAIFAWTGMAAADVTISGIAEMGVFSRDLNIDEDDDGDLDTDSTDIEFFTDIDVTFTLSGATESGLVYGASIDLDESDGNDDSNSSPAFAPESQGGESIFISGGFGTLTMGDTDGALDWAMTETDVNAGSIADDQEHGGWSGNSGLDEQYDGQVLRYGYTIGDFAVGISGEIDDDEADEDGDPVLGIGFRGSFDFAGNSIGFGIGYQNGDDGDDNGDAEAFGVSINTEIAGFSVVLNYSNVDDDDLLNQPDEDDLGTGAVTDELGTDNSFDHYGIGLGYNTDLFQLHANYGQFDFDDGRELEGFGVTAGYALGEDVNLQLGYSNSDDPDNDDEDRDTFSFGLAMSF